MKRCILCFISALALLSYGLISQTCLGLSHTRFNVYVDPHNSSVRVGHTISINITVSNVPEPGLYAYEIKLLYNNSLLEPVSAGIPPDHLLEPTLSPDGVFTVDPGTINATEGFVSFAVTLVGPEPGKTGSGTLAKVDFVIIASGSSVLAIGGNTAGEPKFVDGDGQTVSNQSFSVENGYVDGIQLPPLPIEPPLPTLGKQTLTFNFMGIYGYVVFPEECHPEDIITHELIVAAEPDGIHLNYLRLNISADTPQGELILHNETLENQDLPETWILNKTIALAIPEDAYGRLHCFIETETYRQFTVSDGMVGFDTTKIRTLTYEELQVEYEELLSQYNATLVEIDEWMYKYEELNVTYHELISDHNYTLEQLSYWIGELERINASCNELMKEYSTLNSSYSLLQSNYEYLQSQYNSLSEEFGSLELAYEILNFNYTDMLGRFDELQGNMTVLQNKYNDLSNNYDSLNSAYNTLLQDYENSKSKENPLTLELSLTKGLWLTFVAATVATSIYIVYSAKKKK